ncbi:MAG: HD domain-containing protein [Gemmatimonadaceae bacterium]|nr:HD domain-containing protein [Gemmatimonadaceae bacterium]
MAELKDLTPVITTAVTSVSGAMYMRERNHRVGVERLAAATMETLLNAIDANDAVTGAHVRRVAAYAICLAEAAGLTDREKHSIERIALFHDIGKLDEALFDIFHEDSKLTPQERRAVRKHPEKGAEVLIPISIFYPDLGKGVIAHHERWDGRGYPKRLKGNKIPLAARFVAIADSFDAITHRRRYSMGRSFKVATEAILEGRGTQFDPELVDLFMSPPVLEEVQRIMREAFKPGRKKKGRRIGADSSAPDLTFRWRERSKSKSFSRQARRKSR